MAYVKNLFDSNFIQYASYVIRDRAIPEITDGLKPVQRRIIHTLLKTDDGRFTKVANVCGKIKICPCAFIFQKHPAYFSQGEFFFLNGRVF